MIVILICVLVFANILIQTIIVSELRKTIWKTFFRILALFIWMIDWSTIKFAANKALFETTILKSIIIFITIAKFISIKFDSSIRWWFISTIILISSILSIDEIVIVDFVVLMILLMSEKFSDDLVIDNAWLQNIHQNESVHWRID
jgi:hypothetical protein